MGYGLVNAVFAIVKAAGGYKVSFNLNGASGTPPPDQYILPNGKVTKPSPDPVRSGYIFDGWYNNSACTGSSFNFSSSISADITLYAKWSNCPVVSFSLNGASGSPPSSQTVCSGYAKKPSPDPNWPGYTFGGWYENSTCTGTAVNFDNYKITGDKTFFAKWITSSVAPIAYIKVVNNTGYQEQGFVQIQNSGFNKSFSIGSNSTSPSSGWGSPTTLTPGTYSSAQAFVTPPSGVNPPWYCNVNLQFGTSSSSPPLITSWTSAWNGSPQDRGISLNIANGNTYYIIITLY